MQAFKVNSLNQLTNGTHNGTLTVAGTTMSAATSVTVNTSNAVRYADNTFASTNHNVADGTNTFTAVAADGLGRVDSNTVTVYLPSTTTFLYDANGNLRTNGTMVLAYDDENQLVAVTNGNLASTFTYDGKMRRRVERNYQWTGSFWHQTSERRFVYDGNVILQERDQANIPQVTLTRGMDLSGTLQDAGGIGGLLTMTDHSALNSGISQLAHSYYHADGNGNVTMLIDTNQNVVARYLYDPFGNTLSISGSRAFLNRYRFSSKPIHELSGIYDYLYRCYVPELQRWLNRDPKEELGGVNLFTFALNDATDLVDYWGLQAGGCKEEASCLGCITYAEARGTPDKCQKAVADAIKNRASKGNKNVCDVIAEPGQFNGYNNKNYQDCWNDKCQNIPNGPQNKTERDQAFKNAASGVASENAGDATFFNDNSVGVPPWIERNIRTGRMSEVKIPGCNRFRFFKVN